MKIANTPTCFVKTAIYRGKGGGGATPDGKLFLQAFFFYRFWQCMVTRSKNPKESKIKDKSYRYGNIVVWSW